MLKNIDGSRASGSEHWMSGWQSYSACGWVYPYSQKADDELVKIRHDKNGDPYMRFILCVPNMNGENYFFFPVFIFGKTTIPIQKIIRFGDFVNVHGHWSQTQVELQSAIPGKKRLRNWHHITCTQVNKLVHVRTRKEIEEARKREPHTFMALTIAEKVKKHEGKQYPFE